MKRGFPGVLFLVFLCLASLGTVAELAGQNALPFHLVGSAEAAEAVPDEFCDDGALVGPIQRIKQRYREWEGSGATGLTVFSSQPEALELMADLAGTRD